MLTGPETTSFGPEPKPAPHELLIQLVYAESGVHIMVLTDLMVPENDGGRYKALVLSQDELDYLQNTDPDSVVTYAHNLDGPNPSFSTLKADVGLPLGWAMGNPMGVSAATEEEAVRLAYTAWVGCATTPPPTQLPLQ